MDEMRYGLMSNFRRSWSPVGVRAVLDQQQAFINSYLYTAIAPLSGESFHLMGFDDMNGDCELLFLTELKKQHPNQHVIVVWDNAPCHRRKAFKTMEGLSVINLPSYSPELNPPERFFEEIRRSTADEIFKTLEDIETRIENTIKLWMSDLSAMRQLLCYDWIKEQCGEVC
jgi:transposase